MSDEEKRYNDNKGAYNTNGNSDRVNNFDEEFFDNFDNESNMEDADEDLLALLDMISAQDYDMPYEEDLLAVHPTEVNEEDYTPSNKVSEDIIALDENEYIHEAELNNNLSDEEDIDHLVDSILDFNMNQEPEKKKEVEEPAVENINDVGGIFSNVLSAVDLLDDKTEAEFAKLTQNFDNKKQEEKQEKLSFFQKLFGKKKDKKKNVKTAETNNDKAKTKKEVKSKKELKKSKEKDNKSSKANTGAISLNEDEQINPVKPAEPKAKKANKDKKKQEKNKPEKKKAEKQKKIKKKPEPKVKPIKKAKKVVNEVAEEIEEFKVSKLAIIFAATFIILCSGFVTLGTNAYSYSLNVKNAKISFERGRYTEAYYEICGLDVRPQDQVAYDKIMTVMYINKELNSYNNYMSMERYPEALDSLLKGLERYDKYLGRAKELGIKKNLDSVKASILDELATTYGLTAKQAKKLNAIEDQSQYSLDVISIALENVKKVASE